MKDEAMLHNVEKQYIEYCKKYLREGVFSWAVAVNRAKHLMDQLTELKVTPVKGHPPFDKVKSYEIVKCGKIYVLLGKVLCNFIDGQALENFEMAMGIDKNCLAIWWDLNSPNYIKDSDPVNSCKKIKQG